MHETDFDAGSQSERTRNEILQSLEQAVLALVSLNMRLYDVNMTLLSEKSPDRAKDLFALHAEGGHRNPPIYLPVADDAMADDDRLGG